MALLRESGQASGDSYELSAIITATAGDARVPHGGTLLALVDAVLTGDDGQCEAARRATIEAVGPAAFVDVCATVASFNAVVKLADGTGIPLEAAKAERTRDLRAELGIDTLRSRA